MVFFAQKVLRKVAGNWTFVVVNDRVELDDQIAMTFEALTATLKRGQRRCIEQPAISMFCQWAGAIVLIHH